MLYTVSGRAPSLITTGIAILLAVGMHMSAGARSQDQARSHHSAAPAQPYRQG